MSNKKPGKKKVVVTTSNQKKTKAKEQVANKTANSSKKRKISPTVSSREKKRSVSSATTAPQELIFGRENYIILGVGILLIAVGLALMSGGSMPSPDVWDENLIYGFRRTVLAPILILAGLSVEIYGIFKR